MASSGEVFGAFSGRNRFWLRVAVSRAETDLHGNRARWDGSLSVINLDSSSITWAGGSFPASMYVNNLTYFEGSTPNGVFDFRDGAREHMIHVGTAWFGYDLFGRGTIAFSGGVSGANIFGSANASDQITADRIPKTPGKPPAPSLQSRTSDSFTYGFAVPGDDGGSNLTGFSHEISANSGFTDIVRSFTDNSSPAVASPLEPGTQYWARYRAWNNLGPGPTSDPLAVTTLAEAPFAPGSLSNTLTIPNTVNLAWGAPDNRGSAILEYQVQYAPNSTFSGASTVSAGTARTDVIAGLTINTTWYFRVRARNSIGWGAWSAATSRFVPGVPSAPDLPDITNVTGSAMRIAWEAPGANGASITAYDLQVANNSSMSGATLISLGNVLAYQASNLDLGTSYYWRVRARNSQGVGAFSGVRGATTKDTPSAPGRPTVTGITPKAMRVAWTAPATNGGYAVSGYTLRRSLSPNMTNTTTYELGNVLAYYADDLTPGTTYYWQVIAKNSLGSGTGSAVSAAYRTNSGAYLGRDNAYPPIEVYVGVDGTYKLVDILVADPNSESYVIAG